MLFCTIKHIFPYHFIFNFILSLFIFTACDSGGSGPADVAATDITLKSSTSLVVGNTEQLEAAVLPAGAVNTTIIWSSDDSGIASVSSGLVTANNPGTTTITAALSVNSSIYAECVVTVSAIVVPVTGLTVKSSTSIPVYSSESLALTFSPSNATNQNVTWSSDNPAVALVISGTVTGKSTGTATITVTSVDNNTIYKTCAVTVTKNFAMASTPGDVIRVIKGLTNFNMLYVNDSNVDINFPTGADDLGTPGTIKTKYFLSETEVTYELWSIVYKWATGDANMDGVISGVEIAGTYIIPHAGDKGGVSFSALVNNINHPVTAINWRDALVWCNALTEYYNANNGIDTDLDCVYYSDSAYNTPIRTSLDTGSVSYADGSTDQPYIKAIANSNKVMANCSAKGFRLPTSFEWQYAARYRGNDSVNTVSGYYDPYFTKGNSASGASKSYDAADTDTGTYAVYSAYQTAVVKSKGSAGKNFLGFYDMSGNVYEFCFDWYASNVSRIIQNGSWNSSAAHMQLGYSEYSTPYSEGRWTGFRLAKTK